MSTWRGRCSAALASFLVMTVSGGCAATPLSRYPDFPKMKPTLGTIAVLADVTSMIYRSGDVQNLDLVESEQFATMLLIEIASELRQKGYVVGKTIHATIGWSFRPGTQVYVIRTVEDRGRDDALPVAPLPFWVNQELAGDPALKQAWETLRSAGSATDAPSRLGKAFDADTLVIVALASNRVPTSVGFGRAILSGLTLGATKVPVTTQRQMISFMDTRNGRVLWLDGAAAQAAPLNERVVKNTAQALIRPLP